jgi:hypothetical protein
MRNQRIKSGVVIVALSKYADIWNDFNRNLKEFAEGYDRVLVRDGRLIQKPEGWALVQGPKQFSMAGNANLGWKAVDQTKDILYLGDDVRFVESDTVERLRDLAYSDPQIGLLSPMILGSADNPLQTNPPQDRDVVYSEKFLALVCTYIKREVIQKVGYLDDITFLGVYGNDDADYCRRAKNKGFRLAVASKVKVKHGLHYGGTETFLRNVGGSWDDLDAQVSEADRRYLAKWGDLNK